MYATDVCALVIYHRMQHIEINFYIRYIMSRHPYSTPTAFSWWCRPNCKKKVRAPEFDLGLLEIMCWESHGLQIFKVSVDPCKMCQVIDKMIFDGLTGISDDRDTLLHLPDASVDN